MSTETDAVDHYVLTLPSLTELSGKNIFAAFLEFYADVSARPETLQVVGADSTLDTYTYQDEEPVLEIYALAGDYQGAIDLEEVRQYPVSLEGVRPGSGRRIRVDIAPILALFAATPTRNHGLVLGSLSGRRTGIFEIDANGKGSGIVATLTVHYE